MKGLNNQSGFTIIELVLSFVFVFTLAFSMYQLVFNYKERRDQESLSKMMTDYKNEIVLAVQRDISDRVLKSIDYCKNGSELVEKCLVLYFNDGSKKQLSVEKEQIEYDGDYVDVDYIKYGNVKYHNDEALLTEFKANYMLYKTYKEDELGENVIIYKIAIPIYHNDLGDEDYGVYVTAIGYDYDAQAAEGDGDTPTPINAQTSEGRLFSSDYHMKCITNNFSRSDVYKQTMIVRFKINDLNKAKGSHVMSNMNMNGSALSIDNGGHLCYSVYLKSTESEKPKLYKKCTTTILVANEWYNAVGGFESNASATNESGTGYKLTVTIDGTTSSANGSTSFSNYRIAGSNMNYGIGVEPGNAINLGFFDGVIQDAALYNGIAPTASQINSLGTGSIKTKIESVFGTANRAFHYDFTDNSVYANYCLD